MRPTLKSLLALALLLVCSGRETHAQFGGGGNATTYMSTSLLVLGDTSKAPLDEGSLNALFTPAFVEEATEKLKKALGDEVEFDLRPKQITFQYVSDAQKSSDAYVARITVGFIDPPEELLDQLSIKAPNAVLDLLKDRVYDYLNFRHDLHHTDLRKQQERLTQLKEELEARLADLQRKLSESTVLVSTAELRDHYSALKHRQREDRMQALNVAAERDAIENQIEELTAGIREVEDDSPLLLELKDAVGARQKTLEELRTRFGDKSEELSQLRESIEQAEQAVAAARSNQATDESQQEVHLANLKAKLLETRHKLADAIRDQRRQLLDAEKSLAQGRIEYLRQKEELTRNQVGGTLEKLNEMLAQVAIQADSANARREAIAKEMDAVAESIADRNTIDIDRKRIEREANLIEGQLDRIRHELFDIEISLKHVPRQEFAILPWGS